MRAIKIFLDDIATDHIGCVVENLNHFQNIAATMCAKNEMFVAALDEPAYECTKRILQTEFNGNFSIENVK